jgi:hypothetical protein
MADLSGFMQRLRVQPWYQGVADTFQKANINPALWVSTLYTEDGQTLDPAQVGDKGAAHGLFQLHLDRGSVGDGMTIDQANDPIANAMRAAQTMKAQLIADGHTTADLPTQLRSIENAGWNGGLGEDKQRQQNLLDTVSQMGPGSSTWWNQPNPLGIGAPAGTLSPEQQKAQNDTAQLKKDTIDKESAIVNPIVGAAQAIAIAVAIGGAFLALVAGGFSILTSSDDSGGGSTRIVPVPV